jgi:hypothetical protein
MQQHNGARKTDRNQRSLWVSLASERFLKKVAVLGVMAALAACSSGVAIDQSGSHIQGKASSVLPDPYVQSGSLFAWANSNSPSGFDVLTGNWIVPQVPSQLKPNAGPGFDMKFANLDQAEFQISLMLDGARWILRPAAWTSTKTYKTNDVPVNPGDTVSVVFYSAGFASVSVNGTFAATVVIPGADFVFDYLHVRYTIDSIPSCHYLPGNNWINFTNLKVVEDSTWRTPDWIAAPEFDYPDRFECGLSVFPGTDSVQYVWDSVH